MARADATELRPLSEAQGPTRHKAHAGELHLKGDGGLGLDGCKGSFFDVFATLRGRCHAEPCEGLCRTGHRHDLVHARADRAFEGADTLRVADRQDTLPGEAVTHGVIGDDADLTPIAPIDAECGN